MSALFHHDGVTLNREAVEVATEAAIRERARHQISDPFTDEEATADAALIAIAAYIKAAGGITSARVVVVAEPLPEPPSEVAEAFREMEPTGREFGGEAA